VWFASAAGSWIGSNAVVLADVGRETIVGARARS
jgi:acetyltransferase-like isoleucine patch superfamily enzyme